GTEIGRRAKSIMDRGELVGDDVMIEIVRERLDCPDTGGGVGPEGVPGPGGSPGFARRVRARRVSAHRGPGRGARPDHGRSRPVDRRRYPGTGGGTGTTAGGAAGMGERREHWGGRRPRAR